ncbi:MAG: hypothetical protein QM679_04350 [Patulibacter sp.]
MYADALRHLGRWLGERPAITVVRDAGQLLPYGSWEREIRGCAVQAVEQLSGLTGLPPHALDMALWTRGQDAAYKARPRHRHRTVFS